MFFTGNKPNLYALLGNDYIQFIITAFCYLIFQAKKKSYFTIVKYNG